jgi:hypothetical protein
MPAVFAAALHVDCRRALAPATHREADDWKTASRVRRFESLLPYQ